MLQSAYFLATIAADTADNEQHFAEIACAMIVADGHRWWGSDSKRKIDLVKAALLKRSDLPYYVTGCKVGAGWAGRGK